MTVKTSAKIGVYAIFNRANHFLQEFAFLQFCKKYDICNLN